MSVKRTRQNASQLANKHQCLKSAADPEETFGEAKEGARRTSRFHNE